VSRRPSVIGSLGIGRAPAAAEAAPTSRPKPKAPEIVHTSLYVPRAAYRKLQEIALVQERKVHDIIMDGIDTVLQGHGHRRPSGENVAHFYARNGPMSCNSPARSVSMQTRYRGWILTLEAP
jgi:hypothetical protein